MDALKQRFDRDGYVVVPDLLTPDQLAELREHADAVLDGTLKPEPASGLDEFTTQFEPKVKDDPSIPRRDKVRVVFHLTHTHPYFRALAESPPILGAMEALLGSPLRYYTDQMFVKPPRHGSLVPWHQDAAYWPCVEPRLVSLWLALDEVTIANGCVRFIPGSHREALPHHVVDSGTPNRLATRPEYVDASREVPVELRPGSACIHHSLTLHHSLANESDKGRRGLVMIYMPGDTRFVQPWPFQYGFPMLPRCAN